MKIKLLQQHISSWHEACWIIMPSVRNPKSFVVAASAASQGLVNIQFTVMPNTMNISNHKGFEIAINIRSHLLRLVLWGIWDVGMAKKYKYAIREKLEEIRVNGKEWCAIADFSALYPLSEDVQFMIRECLDLATQQGMKKIVYVGNRSMLQLRLDRVFQQQGEQNGEFAETTEKAICWLLQDTGNQGGGDSNERADKRI